MSTTLPSGLAGLQHLEPEVIVLADDILVDQGPFQFAGESLTKHTVAFAERLMECRVYRKMPVAKQHVPVCGE